VHCGSVALRLRVSRACRGYRSRHVSSREQQTRSAATHSHTLDRGLRALEVLARHPDGLSVAQLADALGTHRAAVYRLLGPLGDHHLIRRDEDGRFALGPGLIELAAGVRPRLRETAEPVLQRLADQLGATTALTLRDGEEAVVALVLFPSELPMHLTYRAGMRHPLTQGCPGHVLLAAAAPKPGEPADVTRAREFGYGVSRGELLPGATGVAAAVCAPGHEPGASISAVWIEGLDPDLAAPAVIAAAREIAARLWR
jgi:DNA-binding IclR family transcriptional regulator